MFELIIFILVLAVIYYFNSEKIDNLLINPTTDKRVVDDIINTQLKSDINKYEELLQVASEFFDNKDYISSLDKYIECLDYNQKDSHVYNRVGYIYTISKDYSSALHSFEEGLAIEDNSINHYNVGMSNYHLKRFHKAIANFKDSLELDFQINRALMLAKCYGLVEDLDNESLIINKCLEQDSENVNIIIYLARSYTKNKEYIKARQAYSKVLKIEPKNIEANNYLKKGLRGV